MITLFSYSLNDRDKINIHSLLNGLMLRVNKCKKKTVQVCKRINSWALVSLQMLNFLKYNL